MSDDFKSNAEDDDEDGEEDLCTRGCKITEIHDEGYICWKLRKGDRCYELSSDESYANIILIRVEDGDGLYS
jgi:hypothetical protein